MFEHLREIEGFDVFITQLYLTTDPSALPSCELTVLHISR